MRDIKQQILQEYGLSYLSQGIELIQRGKLFDNDKSLAKQGFRLRDIISLMIKQEDISGIPFQFKLDRFGNKRNLDGTINLRYYASKLVDNWISSMKKNIRELGFDPDILNLRDFFLTKGEINKLLRSKLISDIVDIIGPEGKIKYGWEGFTYRFIDKETGFYQVGFTKSPHPVRFNWYMFDLIAHPEKRVFRKTGEKTIYGWIINYLENQYGLDFFKKGNVYDFHLIEEKIFERFEFEVTGVFWGDKALRTAETEQIAIGKIGSNIQEVKNWLLKEGFTLKHDDPNILRILNKYELGASVIGNALNDPIAAGKGKGKDLKEFVWWCAYYTALGYSHSQIYEAMVHNHGYRKSLASFKKDYMFIFGSIVDARKILVDPIREELKSEGLSDLEIDQLYPLSREFDIDEFLDLIVSGLSKRRIAQILGFEEGHVGRIAKKIIEERYPDLPMYKFSGVTVSDAVGVGKHEASFEDLQYYLMGELILGYIYQGVLRKDIPGKFVSSVNPNGIGPQMVDRICKRVLGGSYSSLQEEAREILLSIIILDINPKSVPDIYKDVRNWIPGGTMGSKIAQFYSDDKYVRMALSRGITLKPTDIAKVALLGEFLENSYKIGLDDKKILSRLGPAYTLNDLEELTGFIWGLTPTDVRRILFSGYLKF